MDYGFPLVERSSFRGNAFWKYSDKPDLHHFLRRVGIGNFHWRIGWQFLAAGFLENADPEGESSELQGESYAQFLSFPYNGNIF